MGVGQNKSIQGISSSHNVLPELENIIKKNEIPNALLFTGGNVAFLTKTANCFAKAVNCLNPLNKTFFKIPCNECRSCKKITADLHPDILKVIPDNAKIKVAAIRDLYHMIISKPNEAKTRAVIINNADSMNDQAQNAFLKMLEEPPSNTFFILIADNINSLLATIVSRCRSIWFKPEQTKKNKGGLNNKSDDVNSVDDIDIDWAEKREWLLKEVSDIISNNKNSSFNRLKPLLLAEKLSNEPDFLKDYLAIIRTFLRDLAVIRYSPDKIINHEYIKPLISISKMIPIKKNILFFKELYRAERKNQASPSSTRLNLETLFLKLSFKEI